MKVLFPEEKHLKVSDELFEALNKHEMNELDFTICVLCFNARWLKICSKPDKALEWYLEALKNISIHCEDSNEN